MKDILEEAGVKSVSTSTCDTVMMQLPVVIEPVFIFKKCCCIFFHLYFLAFLLTSLEKDTEEEVPR